MYLLPEDDFPLESRQSIKKGNKTEEQIKKYTLEEDLGEAKRTIFLLSKGEPIQRKAILQSLSKTVKEIPDLIGSLFPIIKQILCILDPQLQSLFVQQIVQLIQLLDESMLKDLIGMCLKQIQEWKNQKLSLQWIKLFGILVTKPQFSEFQQQALQLALKLSESKQILPMKMIAARMIAHLSYLLKNRLKGTPLDRIRSFCRDPDIQLRLILVKEVMPLLFQNLGIQLINIYFMERIFEMIYDLEMQIKVAAIDLFLDYYNVLSVEDKQRFSKIIMEHLEDATYSEHLSMKTGIIYEKIRFQLERRSEMGSLINCFATFLSSQQSKVRYNALYNLPGLLIYMGLKIWSDVKKIYFEILIKEEIADVKKLAVSIFPEILKTMELSQFDQFPSNTLLLVKSLNIQTEDIIFCFLEGFPVLFEIFKRTSLELQCNQRDNVSIERTLKSIELNVLGILKALMRVSQKQPKNHYIISKFHSTIAECIKFMNCQTLIDIYFPLLSQALQQSNGITIQSLLECVYQLLYELVSKVQIAPIISQIHRILYDSNSAGKIKFISLSAKLLSCFSSQKYKELDFYQHCIKLADSPVLAVRMQLALYLQQARQYVSEQVDEIFNKLFESKQMLEYLVPEVKISTQQQKQSKKRRNSECLKNQEIQFIISSKKKIQDEQRKKKNFIIKPGPLAYKKNLLKYSIASKNLTTASTSSHSLVPSIVTTGRSQLRNKIIQQIKQTSKSIRKIINNKVSTEQEKQQIEKRKFQSVQISLNKNKISDRKRRKTIFEKKEDAM